MEYSSDFIRPLREAENAFLQVLLSRFTLKRSGRNAVLSVHFDNDTPAISNRHARNHLQDCVPDFTRKQKLYQKRLEAVLLHRTSESFTFEDPDFPFRYCSGGALPVLRMGDREYFCLFYRDIYPVGWNIANGGTDSRAELIYPMTTMERELREELIVLDPKARRRYVFNWDDCAPADRAEYAMFRRIWSATFPKLNIDKYAQLTLPLKWLDGPDSIVVQMGDEEEEKFSGCFLNINAKDFGIEVDKVAKINLDEDVILLDGEIMQNRILNRPVGLFDVDRMDRLLRSGMTSFQPDWFYYDGQREKGERFKRLIETTFTSSLPGIRTPREVAYFASLRDKFGLCPVTQAVIARYADFQDQRAEVAPPPVKTGKARRPSRPKCEVFISYGSGDRELAGSVYEFVTSVTNKIAYYYPEASGDRWSREIDDALESAQYLVLVGTDRHRLKRHWPEYEWRSFHNALLSGRKRRDAKLIPFIVGIKARALPQALNYHRMVICDKLEAGLSELSGLLGRAGHVG